MAKESRFIFMYKCCIYFHKTDKNEGNDVHYDTVVYVVYVVYVYCIACTIVEFIFNLLKYLYRKLDLLEMTIS